MLWHSECLEQCPACTGVQKVSRVWLHVFTFPPLLCPTAHRQHLRSFPPKGSGEPLEGVVLGIPPPNPAQPCSSCLSSPSQLAGKDGPFSAPSGALQMCPFRLQGDEEEEWGGEVTLPTLQSRRRDHKEGNLPAPNSSLSPDLGSSFSPSRCHVAKRCQKQSSGFSRAKGNKRYGSGCSGSRLTP